MKKLLPLILFLVFARSLFALGTEVRISFAPCFNGERLVTGKKYAVNATGDSVTVDLLRFYISDISFLQDGKVVAREAKSYHLIDVNDTSSFIVICKLKKAIHFNSIRFDLGIDSTTNVSGVMGGDLDPTKGMYWTWQSGYINFKIEGTSEKIKDRNQEYQFHIGGYASPNATLQTIQLAAIDSGRISVAINTEKFFDTIDLSKMNHVMSPGKDAVQLSFKAAQLFSIQK